MTIFTDSAGNTYVNNLTDVFSWTSFKDSIVTAVTQVYGNANCVYVNPTTPGHFKLEFNPNADNSGITVDQSAPPYNTTTNILRGSCGGYSFTSNSSSSIFWVNRTIGGTSFTPDTTPVTTTTSHQYYAVLNPYSAIFVVRGVATHGGWLSYFGMPRQNITLPSGSQATTPSNYQAVRFFPSSLGTVNGRIYWLGAQRSFVSARLGYSISCADGQTPSSSGWATDLYLQVQNPSDVNNYPSPGALYNMLVGTDSGFAVDSIYSINIGDGGSTNWLCVLKNTFNSVVKSILVRLPP